MLRGFVRQVTSVLLATSLAGFSCAPSFAGDRDREGQPKTAAANVKHVFLIVLENKTFSNTFGNSTQDPYLQKTLVPSGALLTQYYGTGHVSLDNYISMISGQAPTADTTDDCLPGFTGTVGNFNNVEQTGTAAQGQVVATGGCVYSKKTPNITDQLVEAGYSWKGYMEDMGNDPTRESATCGHPVLGTGTDHTNEAEAPSAAVPLGDAYATRHDPFVYFHSIIDDQKYCDAHVVNLNALTKDLASEKTTPNFVFITPNLCNDGHDGSGTGAAGTLCANGQPGGLTSADAFLQTWIPKIQASPAYKKDGLIVITFDESNLGSETVTVDPTTGQETVNIIFTGDTCCNQQPGPNLSGVRPGTFNLVSSPTLVENLVFNGFGGDQIGAVLLSPFVRAGSTSSVPYNHYSLLRSLEDIFQLHEHIGYAENDPKIDYHLDTIGEDQSVFKSAEECGFGKGGR
jgi:phosphatidylinositol-3-phosphatase